MLSNGSFWSFFEHYGFTVKKFFKKIEETCKKVSFFCVVFILYLINFTTLTHICEW